MGLVWVLRPDLLVPPSNLLRRCPAQGKQRYQVSYELRLISTEHCAA
jgi:hypothetical protein